MLVGKEDCADATGLTSSSESSKSCACVFQSFVCKGCGNDKAMCHQVLFCTMLVQEIISLYKKKYGDVSEQEINETFDSMYNLRLQGLCVLTMVCYLMKGRLWSSCMSS